MTVNLESLTLPELATLAKRYFFIGCFFLPIFWAVNLLWIGSFARTQSQYYQSSTDAMTMAIVKRYAITYSLIGSIFWILVLTTWISIFTFSQTHFPYNTFDKIALAIQKSIQI